MGDLLTRIGRDLLRVVPLAVEYPDTMWAGPRGIHCYVLSIGRVSRIEGVFNKFGFFARREIEYPYVSLLKHAKHIAGLQLHVGPVGPHKRNLRAIR